MKKFRVYGRRAYGPLQDVRSEVFKAKNFSEAWDMAYAKWNRYLVSWMHEIAIIDVKEIK